MPSSILVETSNALEFIKNAAHSRGLEGMETVGSEWMFEHKGATSSDTTCGDGGVGQIRA